MRLISSTYISLGFLTTILPAIHAITLNQWQPIDGFIQDCVNAYNTPLSGCQASDFEQGSCSTNCINFLQSLTNVINAECGGTSAQPNTLIGSFFKGEGTSTLCPNVMEEEGGTNHGNTVTVGGVSTYFLASDVPTSTYTPLVFTTASLPLASATPSLSTTSLTSSSSSTDAATTTQIAVVKTTVAPNTLTPAASPTSTQQSGAMSSSTSIPSTTTATSGGNGNGGGTPLDVGSSSSSNRKFRVKVWELGLVFASTGLLLSS